jgi:hypothetical protein
LEQALSIRKLDAMLAFLRAHKSELDFNEIADAAELVAERWRTRYAADPVSSAAELAAHAGINVESAHKAHQEMHNLVAIQRKEAEAG